MIIKLLLIVVDISFIVFGCLEIVVIFVIKVVIDGINKVVVILFKLWEI